MTEIPVYSECVIGYRHWRVADWVLAPITMGHPWRAGVNHAKCMKERGGLWTPGVDQLEPPPENHTAPHELCDCGLYAFHEPRVENQFVPQENVVLGAVAAWGDLRVHHDGFRAEYAQIVALATQNGIDLTEIASFYRVPVVPLDMLTMEAERHGQPLPVAVRPEKPDPAEYLVTFGSNYYVSSGTWQVSSPIYLSAGATVTWLPADPIEEEKPKLGKKSSNRQGPHQHQRAPKNISPRKGR